MKIVMLLLIILAGKGCQDAQTDMENAVVEYTANTRGFFQKVTVQNKNMTISRDRDGITAPEVIKINDADWKELVSGFSAIDLENIPNLKAPSQKRAFDGAAIADLKITYKDKTYQSEPFDHGNPPTEISLLVNKLAAMGNKKNED